MNSSSQPARALLLTGLVLMLALSGCAGKAKDVKAAAVGTVDASVDDSTGAIKGSIVDEETNPVVGAQVGLQGPDLPATETNLAGEFGLSNIPPGQYTLLVSALGYQSATQAVTVTIGEVTEVEIKVVAQALAGVAYKKVFGPITGKFFCGFGTPAVVGPCKVIGFADPNNPTEVAWQSISGGENNIFEERTIVVDNKSNPDDMLKSLVIEVVWTPTSASAKWLISTIEDLPSSPGARNNSEPEWARTSGTGPLRMEITPGVKNETGTHAMPVNREGFMIGVFPSLDPASPSVTNPTNNRPILLGASAYTEQTFQLWYSLFYNAPAPAGYTALVD